MTSCTTQQPAARGDEMLWEDGQIGSRIAMFCQLGIVGSLEIDLGQHFPSSQLKCGSGLLHQDGDLHAAVPDLRQS